ncbi:hypothetical protein niasHT_007067 [Heterodera trifolii]|uniref:Protein unc-80 n=1 Tax=Heterodera trifolii TaxID=157864 RepID=A0ABD2LXK5_9BILA
MFLGRETSASEEGDGFSAAFEPSLNGGTAGEGAPLVRLNDICNDSTDADSLPPAGKGDNGSGAGSMSEGTATIRAEGARGAIPKTLIVHASGDDTPSSLGSQQTIVSRPPPASAFSCQQTLPPPQMPKIALGTRADSGESERQSSPDTPLGICLDPHEANYLDVAVLRCLLIRNWAEEGTFWAVQYLLGRLITMRQHRCTHEGAFRSRFNSDSATIPIRKTSKTEAATIDTKGYLTWADLQEHNGATFSAGTKRTDKTQPKDTREERTEEAMPGRTGKGVAFERDEMQLQQRSKSDGKQQQRERQQTLGAERTAERRRRISLSAMPSDGTALSPGATSGSMPRPSISSPRRMQRASSIPASFPRLTELLQGFASSCNSPAVQQRRRHEQIAPEKTEPKRKNSHFFTEAIGAASFIEPNGHLSFPVVLKVLGTLMERCCVVRVSEVVLNCCDTFLNMPGSDSAELFPKVLHIVLRICLQLGCPNGCNEGVHTPQAEFLRIKVRNLIAQMHRTNPRFFCALLRAKVAQTPCAQLVDALHSLMVFCQCNFSLERSALASQGRLSVHREGSGAGPSAESGGAFRRTSSSGGGRRISAESAAVSRMPSYKNNFNQAQSGIEGVLMGTLLGPLLDKIASSAHELGQPENMSYAQDIRLLLAFAFDRHGNPFRRNALSALSAKTLAGKIDAIGLPAGRKSMSGSGCGLNIGRGNGGILLQSKSSSALISASNASPSDTAPQPRDGAAASLRRGLFRRMQSTTTATSDVATAGGDSDGGTAQAGGSGSTQSTPPPQLMPSISVDDSIGSPQQQQMAGGGNAVGSKRAKTPHQSTGGGRAGAGGGRLQFALSFLKGRSGGGSADPTNSEEDDGGSSNAADDQPQFGAEDFEGGSLGGLSMDAGGGRLRADKALLRRGEGLGEGGGRGAGRGSAGTKLTGGAAGGDDPLVDIAQQHKPVPKFLPPQRIVQAKEVRAGAARFAFLLENSRPGTFPDSPLVAAISELRSPVLARAVLLVECAHFVHRCNRGDWPDWIRSGMFFAGQHRSLGGGSVGTCPTVPPTPSSNPPSSFRIGTGGGGASRRTALLQRASGRAFYAWGVQLGIRLQKQLDDEAEETKKSAKQTPTMAEQRQLRLHDELEDFLDDASVNDPRGAGDAVPVALQLIVCALLQQITAFLRETLQSLPRASHSQKQKNAIAASSSGWERLQSQRRWSILSNTFNAQTQQLGQQQPIGSGSMHSINELHPTERRVSYSTADEENSPRGSHDMAETEMAQSVAGSHVEKGKDLLYTAHSSPVPPAPSAGGSALSLTLRRFASRTRLFSRGADQRYQHAYISLTQADNDEEDPSTAQFLEQNAVHDDRKPLVPAGSPSAGSLLRSTRSACASSTTTTRSSRKASVRRLAQGRQRLLKRNSPSGGAIQTPPPSSAGTVPQHSVDTVGSTKKRASLRLRKPSQTQKAQMAATEQSQQNELGEIQQKTAENAAVPPVVRRLTTDATTGNVNANDCLLDAVVSPSGGCGRVVSFVQRRRRTASFKSRVSRPPNWRHSMRLGRTATQVEDEASEEMLLSITHSQQKQQRATAAPGAQRHAPAPPEAPRSPVFMLSIARKANVGAVGGGADGRLRVTQPQHQTQQQQQSSPERYSSSTTTANAMFQQQQKHLTEIVAEEDEEEMCRSMPWLNTLLQFGRKIDFDCPHEQFCTKWCFERICRQCQRLFEALTVVYGQGTVEGRIDRRQQFIERWQNNQQREAKKRHSSNPPRRESATVRQSGVDRMPMALRGLIIEKLNEIEESRAKKAEEIDQSVSSSELRLPRPPPIVGFLRVHLLGFIHAPLSALLKGIVVLKSDQLIPCVKIAWTLLIASDDSHLVATAAALFICCAVKCPQECSDLMSAELASADPSVRNAAVQRFFVLWRQRFHVWLKMEEGAQFIFKIPPPSIDFTLPSPSIGLSQLPVVDPPWMPPVKTKVEELSLKEEEQSTSQTIMTMTRTRRKQKQEMVRKAIRRAEERQRELREQYPLRATAVVQQVAYEPALFQHQLTAADSSQADDPALLEPVHQARQIVPVAQPLFPSAILSVVPTIVELLDDAQVDGSGVSVGETCRRVIWSCFVEDTALFLRHFFEKFTNRTKQEYLLALLRRLVLSFHPLPSQTAHTLLNALFGLAMFYVRTPGEGSDRSLALALSLCWLVVPFVHGLYFKDLKQTLKKEQCDQAIMVTANVPSAKKVIVHGPDSQQGGIPTQFPVLEDTQFQHLLADSIEFYNIPAHEAHHFFLYDPKTFVLHNPSAFVRDFYFFHRSFYPQLQLVRLDIGQAQQRIREHALQQKLIETGKVLLTHNALRHSPEAVIPQRIFFLHDEFTHLPSFPRRAVETCFGMYQNTSGAELQTTDALHKFAWSKLIANMFEKMENAFMFGDLHLFINVINGIMIIHCEDVLILRRCMAAYLGMSIHFNSLFASQGFSLIMPTILRCYSQRQPNRMFTQVVEFVCKQFYVLHRKPFLLQMFGSCADLLDQSDSIFEANPMRVKAKYLFALLLAMERMNEPLDQLDILAMLPHPKPLQALDLCYRDEPNTFNILTDAMASCVTICAFAPESRRAHQMLLCMQSMLPHLVRHMEEETNQRQQQAANALAALKLELSAYATLSVEFRALVNSCDVLARGPTRSFDLAATGGGGGTAGGASLAPSSANRPHATDLRRGRSLGGGGADSPQFFDPPTIVEDEVSRQQQSTASAKTEKKLTVSGSADGQTTAATDNEAMKEQFRGPRDGLLTLCSMFVQLGSERLKELGRLSAGLDYSRGGMPELLDHKCHIKLSEVAVALLKLAPYDSNSLGCAGLRHYFTQVMPVVDWSVETNRSAINIILRRLDKTIAKIAKRPSTRRRANWGAISFWLVGLHQTLLNSPYIAHLHSLKTITLLCLRLTLGDPFGILDDQTVPPFTLSAQHSAGAPAGAYLSSAHAPQTVLSAHSPPASFCNVVLRLTSFLMTNLGQLVFSLEMICAVESIGPLAERPEAILCQFLIPMFLRAAIPGKDAPQFRAKDLNFCLSLLQNAISPPSLTKQSVAPAMSGSSLATSLMKDTAGGRQGSVSVTDRGGYSATVSTTRIMRDSVVLTVMLAIKVIVIAFHKQLTIGQWMRIARIVREIVAKKCGGAALSPFLKFMLGTNLPVTELLQSIVLNKLNQRTVNDIDANWVGELRERIARVRSDPTRKSHLAMLRSLHSELYLLREDFITRNLEVPRSHTPTIGGELHSDSGSSLGGASAANRSESAARRLSSTALGKLRWIQSKSGESAERSQGGPKVSLTGTLQDSTILEDAEDENASGDGAEGATVAARVSKSPSLPFSRRSQRDRRGLGMFRSVRRMRQPRLATSFESEPIEGGSETPTTTGGMELDEVTTSSQRYSSLKSVGHQNDKSEKDKGTEDNTQCTTSQSSINKLSTSERPRVVSFSTPRHSSVSQTISEADSDGTVEFCITSTKHLI